MKFFKPKFWDKKNLNFFSIILLPISFFLQILTFLKNKVTITSKFQIPIICIGNLYLGGTGKTPLSIELSSILTKIGKKPVILKKNYENHHDEIQLLKHRFSDLIINKNRSQGIKNALSKNYNVVVLDDGLQDKSIFKNLNIVCFSLPQSYGNGLTIPAGPLREPINNLKNYQIVMINSNNKNEFDLFREEIIKLSSSISIYHTEYVVDMQKIKELYNYKILAFAGIGNPDNFFNLLIDNKLDLQNKISFPDHYNFSKNELKEIISIAQKNNQKILTTEKDYFRIKDYGFKEIDYVPIYLKINSKEKFIKEIESYL